MTETISGPPELTQQELIRAGYDLVPYERGERGWPVVVLGAAAIAIFATTHFGMHTDRGPGPRTDIVPPTASLVDTRFSDMSLMQVPSITPLEEHHHVARQNGVSTELPPKRTN